MLRWLIALRMLISLSRLSSSLLVSFCRETALMATGTLDFCVHGQHLHENEGTVRGGGKAQCDMPRQAAFAPEPYTAARDRT